MVCPSALVVIISAEIMLGLHYPVADVNLREFLLDRFISSTDRLQVHFYSALASIFHEVRKEVRYSSLLKLSKQRGPCSLLERTSHAESLPGNTGE